MNAKRPRAELIQLLAEQRQALAASCEGYDQGNEWEAARLATTVFTLLHDGGSITSVLTQLDIRESVPYTSTGRKIDRQNLLPDHPLLMFKMGPGIKAKYHPKLNDGPPGDLRPTPFPEWWANELVIRHGPVELTRRRLVFALRHQDGGGHVGELTDPAYIMFKTKALWNAVSAGEPPRPMLDLIPATMRQVAFEVSHTLGRMGEIT